MCYTNDGLIAVVFGSKVHDDIIECSGNAFRIAVPTREKYTDHRGMPRTEGQ